MITEPGIYPDVREAEYHAHPALSQSMAKILLDCPARFRWLLDNRAVVHRIAAGTLAATKVGEARTNAYIIERAEVERIKATDLDAWVDSLPDG